MGYYDGANYRIVEFVPLRARRVLEIGCAEGKLGAEIKSRNQCEYWGIDVHEPSIEVAETRLDQALCIDIESVSPLPLPDDSFDCLIFGDVLEHLQDPEKLLSSMRRHLIPECTLVVNVPNVAHWSVIQQLLSGNFEYADSGILDRTHLRFFTPNSFRAMLWRCGFVPTAVKYLTIPNVEQIDWTGVARSLNVAPSVAAATPDIYQFTFQAQLAQTSVTSIVGPHADMLGKASKPGSIVIVTFNSHSTITKCVTSVLETTHEDVEVIVVDNASSDSTLDLVQAIGSSRVQIISSAENLGYSKSANLGLRASLGEALILLNPDCEVYPGWYERLIATLHQDGVGAVGPTSDRVAGYQFVGFHLPQNVRPPIEEIHELLESVNQSSTLETKLLIGFCMATTRTVLNLVGLLDEAMTLGSDDLEFSWRLRQFGYRLLICRDVFVRHHLGVSFASVESSTVQDLVDVSDEALYRKLKGYYGDLTYLKSSDLWDCGIFDPALDRLRGPKQSDRPQ